MTKRCSDLLNARKKQLDTSLATASVITLAFADFAGLESQSLDGDSSARGVRQPAAGVE